MAVKSRNKQVVERYVDGFNKLDPAQILSCLTDDNRRTYLITGNQSWGEYVEGVGITGPARTTITRMVEEDDVVMVETTVEAMRWTGELMWAVTGEVFVMRDGKIAERRAYVVELKGTEFK